MTSDQGLFTQTMHSKWPKPGLLVTVIYIASIDSINVEDLKMPRFDQRSLHPRQRLPALLHKSGLGE